MKNEAKIWMDFAGENLKSAEILLQNSLYNPCLQNAQQCVEKALKALLIKKEIIFKRTHDIFELNQILTHNSVVIDISEEECDLLNSIYLPTKYPLGNALPDFILDKNICGEILEITKRVFHEVKKQIPG